MASPKLYTWSHVADDLLTQRAKNGDIGECYAVGDAYYHYYLDNNSTDTNLLYTAEHWFNRGNRLGGTAGITHWGWYICSMQNCTAVIRINIFKPCVKRNIISCVLYIKTKIWRRVMSWACYILIMRML